MKHFENEVGKHQAHLIHLTEFSKKIISKLCTVFIDNTEFQFQIKEDYRQ